VEKLNTHVNRDTVLEALDQLTNTIDAVAQAVKQLKHSVEHDTPQPTLHNSQHNGKQDKSGGGRQSGSNNDGKIKNRILH
jgi:uncharacterized protein YoxC